MRNKWLIRIAIIAVVIFCLFGLIFVIIPDAKAWNSNDFKSPTGNILCHSDWARQEISCGTLNNGDSVILQVNSYPTYYPKLVYQYVNKPNQLVLHYGRIWRSTYGVRCRSTTYFMECMSTHTWVGFRINRSGIRMLEFKP